MVLAGPVAKPIIEKLAALERRISSERGPFVLFAIFEREGSRGRWDLVVSAPWIQTDEMQALRFLSAELRKYLSRKELVSISRIVPIDPKDARLDAILSAIHVEHGCVEVSNATFFGLDIERAHILSASRPGPTANPVRSQEGTVEG